MKILSLYRKQIPFTKITINRGINYVPFVVTSLTITPNGAVKGFTYKKPYDDSINTEWLKLSEKISMKVNGNMAQFKKSQ